MNNCREGFEFSLCGHWHVYVKCLKRNVQNNFQKRILISVLKRVLTPKIP
jgi:hypothetical protein